MGFLEWISHLRGRIHRRFCRHKWRPSNSEPGMMVCTLCGKRVAE